MAYPSEPVQAHRPVVMGVNGMVAAAHPLASLAGLRALVDGGNAFDATVATAAALNVVEPYMSGMGGIGSLLAYIAKENRIRVLNFTGRAPKAAQTSLFTRENMERGILSVLVPGAVAGWLSLHETYGRLDREKLFSHAISYAGEGFPITHLNHFLISDAETRWSPHSSSRAILMPGGGIPAAGTRLRQTQLASSLREVAKGGHDAFYRGRLAQRIARGCQEMGGLITEEDLAEYQPWWEEPILVPYRGYEVYVPPPNSDGFQVLETMNMLERFQPTELSYGTPGTLHLMMEACKLAVTDRIRYSGDPNYTDIPIKALLSKEYAAQLKRRIDPTAAASVHGERYNQDAPGDALAPIQLDPSLAGSTTHFSVADAEGNVVSLTQSLGSVFGSGIAIGDTGIFLNNMADYFDLAPLGASPNVIGPGRLVEWPPAPAQVLKDGRFFLSIGTPGGYGILQTTSQMLVHVLEFGMNVQQAIEAPRFRCTIGRRVQMEERFPHDVRAELSRLGHEIEPVGPWSRSVGGAQGVLVDQESGFLSGGADPRRDGYAMGW